MAGAHARLFFALLPPETLRDALAAVAVQACRGSGARLIPRDHLHLTLRFLGNYPLGQIESLCQTVDRLKVPQFDLHLTRLEQHRRPDMLWAVADHLPPPLSALVSMLSVLDEATSAGSQEAAAHPTFCPHVTLARRLSAPLEEPALASPMSLPIWRATHFALMQSTLNQDGALYEPIAHFALSR